MRRLFVLVCLLAAPLSSFASVEIQQKPVSVMAEPMGQDQYLSYNFGAVFINSRTSVEFTLTARGPDATEIKRITISGPMYDATSNCPAILQVGQTCSTRVYYWPRLQGPHWGDLNFNLNDGNIYIRLFGDTFRQ